MRVTHRMIANTVIRNVNRNLAQMTRYQDMLSSGKAINKPSDDPVRIARIMGYQASLQQNKHHQRNIDATMSWLDTTEDALSGMTDVLQRARELAVSGADGTKPPESRRAIAKEIDELVGVLVQLANTSFGGRHIFAGYQTTASPFSRDKRLLATEPTSVVYHGDRCEIRWEVAPGVEVKGNIDGEALLMDTRIFEYMEDLIAGLESDDLAAVNTALGNLSAGIDIILDHRAALGAIRNGLELTMNKTTLEELNITSLRSKLEDIDFAETFMYYSTMATLYTASLSAGARIMVPSLIDFLR